MNILDINKIFSQNFKQNTNTILHIKTYSVRWGVARLLIVHLFFRNDLNNNTRVCVYKTHVLSFQYTGKKLCGVRNDRKKANITFITLRINYKNWFICVAWSVSEYVCVCRINAITATKSPYVGVMEKRCVCVCVCFHYSRILLVLSCVSYIVGRGAKGKLGLYV